MSPLLLLLIDKHLTEKESYSRKMDLPTKITVVNDAILFVSGKSKDNVKPSSEDDKEGSNELEYYEDQDQLEDSKRVQENDHQPSFLIRFTQHYRKTSIIACRVTYLTKGIDIYVQQVNVLVVFI